VLPVQLVEIDKLYAMQNIVCRLRKMQIIIVGNVILNFKFLEKLDEHMRKTYKLIVNNEEP